MTKRERRTFSPEFKKQMVQLYQNGKTKRAFIDEYDLTPSSLDRWINQDETSGFFKEKDNRSSEQQELLELRKELKQLRMENDILKQAALIMGRK
jgi:transposase